MKQKIKGKYKQQQFSVSFSSCKGILEGRKDPFSLHLKWRDNMCGLWMEDFEKTAGCTGNVEQFEHRTRTLEISSAQNSAQPSILCQSEH